MFRTHVLLPATLSLALCLFNPMKQTEVDSIATVQRETQRV